MFDGLFVHDPGAKAGRHVDTRIQRESRISQLLVQAQIGEPVLYHSATDKGFYMDVAIRPMHNNVVNTLQQTMDNRDMSSMRASCEIDIGRKSELFKYIDAHRMHNTQRQPLGLFFRVILVFTNTINCLDACATSKFYDCPPHTLEEYFA